MSALSPGMVIAGDFRILRPLSAGGMGAVYVALQMSTNRERALKVMLGDLAQNEDLKSRFVQEARVGSQIDSDHAVEVVAAGIDPSIGAPWLAMELLEGEDLAHFLARSGPLAPEMVLDLFDQLTHALGAAHAKGIVHRDLKPENVFLARSRRAHGSFMVKVLDFGIAKLLGVAKSSATAAIGTPLWMAPEQTQASHAIAPAADVWSMGLIAFRALSGRLFWKTATDPNASSMMILREVVFEPIACASERARELVGAPLPPGFDAWFARCVDRDPGRRFPDAAAMQVELRTVLGGVQPTGPTVGAQHAAWQTAPAPHPAEMRRGVSAPMASGISAPMFPGPSMHQAPAFAQSAPMPAPSFVTVPPVVQTNAGGATFGIRPPPPRASRKKSRAGLYALLGAAGAALLVGAIVLLSDGSSNKKSDASARKSAAARLPPPPAAETPFAPTQAWVGSYVCEGIRAGVTLRVGSVVGRTVNVITEFTRRGVAGSYRSSGTYEPATRKLKLMPGAWIRQPPNYETVGMDGAVSADGATYSGRMMNPRCAAFTTQLAPSALPGAPAPVAPRAYPPQPAAPQPAAPQPAAPQPAAPQPAAPQPEAPQPAAPQPEAPQDPEPMP